MKAKYDEIGDNYNMTRKADPYLLSQFELLLNLKENGAYLDVGCGTGNYTVALHRNNINLIGIDPSAEMLSIAKKTNSKIKWLQGSVENLPLASEIIDGVFGSMTIHHWSNLDAGFSEINRVLKPQGTLVIFTSTAEQMQNYWLNHYFPKMMADSIEQMPSLSAIESALSMSGFTFYDKKIYSVSNDLQDKFLYSGKHHPEMYLDNSIRKGISSFVSLAYKSEVESGLLKLASDIHSKEIFNIIHSYENELGDYLFIRANKTDA